jgi:hypothetical protein
MEWFEKKYPGWYGYYGKFWEAYGHMADPDDHTLITKALGGLPNFCQVCQLPTIFPRPDESFAQTLEKDGRMLTFCSQGANGSMSAIPGIIPVSKHSTISMMGGTWRTLFSTSAICGATAKR